MLGIFGRNARKKAGAPNMRNSEITVDAAVPMPAEEIFLVQTAMATHIGTRSYQQDAAYVSEPLAAPGTAFGILCDGMGGMDSGELVSSDVVAFLANGIAALGPDDDIPAFFARAIPEANEMVQQRYNVGGKECGTTLVCTVIQESKLYWASVGDSRIYIVRDGEIAQMTRDHTYALKLQQMVDAGHLSQDAADTDPQREALVGYIGAPVLEMMDISPAYFELLPGDILLLCSDGLVKSINNARILELLNENRHSLRTAAQVLVLAAFDESPGGQDNTSVILMQYLGPPGPPAPPAPCAEYTVQIEEAEFIQRSEESNESGEM